MDKIEKRLKVLFELEKYKDVLSLAYENLQSAENDQWLLYQYIILSHMNLGDYRKSLEICDKALGVYPSVSLFLYFKSKAYGYMDAYQKAINELKKVLAIEPNEPSYLAQYAKLLLTQDKIIKAKVHIEKALKLDATNLEYHLVLARILYMSGDKKEASKIVKEVLAKDPYHEEALEIKQKFFTSKLKEREPILKNLLSLNPFDKESQKDIKFIKFYYKYIPLLMGIVIFLSYLLQSHRDQFGYLESVVFVSFVVVATIGSNDWRLNVPFIATIIGFDAYFNTGSRGIESGEIFYILFMTAIFQLFFKGVYLLYGGLKYSFFVKLQQQKNDKRNPIIFFLFIAPFEKYEKIDTKAMKNYYMKVPLLMMLSMALIYIYTFYFQGFYFKLVLIVLFFIVATMSTKNILLTWLYIFGTLSIINRFECDGILWCIFSSLFLSLVFPMFYNLSRSVRWMKK